jgi:hypothetical protein
MSALLPLVVAGCLIAVAMLLTTLRQRRAVQLEGPVDAFGRIARHTAGWQVAGLSLGLLAAASMAFTEPLDLGRAMLVSAPAFGLCVLVGVLIGEATAVPPPSTPSRFAAIETRRARDYLPPRLTGMVTLLGGMLALLLAAGSWTATSDDLGRAGRALRLTCGDGLVAVGSPWPGPFYGAPLAVMVGTGLLLAILVLRRVVRRPRAGLAPESRAVDDLVRQRSARTIVSACGVVIAVPLAGTSFVAAGRLLSMPCTPTGAVAAGWGLLAVALGTLGCLGWFSMVLLAPVRAANAAHRSARSR